MLITSKRRVTSRLSSMFSFPIWSLPACSSAISSSTGEIILHGPHHSAQKSTRTGTSEPLTCSSNVASLRVTIFSLMRSPLSSTCNAVGETSVPARRCCCRLFAALLQPVLGVDGGHAAGSGRCDGLAVDVVLYVPAGEDAVHTGA